MTSTKRKSPEAALPAGLELTQDGIQLVSLTFGLSLYTDALFSTVPDAVLGCYDRFLKLCPREALRFYATENMTQHKPVTERTFGMLSTWLKPGAPPRKYIALELKSGHDPNSAPEYRFEVYGGEKGSTPYAKAHANLISMALPAAWGFDRASEMLDCVRDLCEVFPVRSGHAGFRFECSPYQEETAQTHAWRKSMRHRGIDIAAHPHDKKLVGHDGVRGPGWLTILGHGLVDQLGGQKSIRSHLPSSVAIHPYREGIILQAGQAPGIGDTNRKDFLPDYAAVYRLIAPLIQFDRSPALLAGSEDDYWDNTLAWLKRFEDE